MNNLPRTSLSLVQKILLTGASPEVVNHALDEGLFTTQDVNACCEGEPLVASWLKNQTDSIRSLAVAALRAGVAADLNWQLGAPALMQQPWTQERSVRHALSVEHALIRLVGLGLDPLQPWSSRKNSPENLLQWASMTNRPWLLKACLETLSSSQCRQCVEGVQIAAEETEDGEEWVPLPVVHASLRAGRLEVAQVWHAFGAKLDVLDVQGESAVFSVASAAALRWVLASGCSLNERRFDGAAPVQMWSRQASDEVMSALRDEAQVALAAQGADTHQHTLGLIGAALDQRNLSALKDLWPRVDKEVVLPNGMTPLGCVSRTLLSTWSNRARDNHRLGNTRKILAFLWHRTDLVTADAVRLEGASDLEVASLVARLLGGQVSRSEDLAKVKQPMPNQGARQTLRLGETLVKPPVAGDLRRSKEATNDVLFRRQRIAAAAIELLVGEVRQMRTQPLAPEQERQAVQTLEGVHEFLQAGQSDGVGSRNATETVHLHRLALDAARKGILSEEVCSLWYASCLRSIAVYGVGVDLSGSAQEAVELVDLLEEVADACDNDHGNVNSDGFVHALCVLAAGWGDRGTALASSKVLNALEGLELQSIPAVRGLMPLIMRARLDTTFDEVAASPSRGPRM